jgi:putative peptidoglycan lipid II flippase
VLYYADRVNQLPLGVIGAAVGTALLPLLSRQLRAGDEAAATASINRALEYALFLTLPAALALIVAAQPVMGVLFGRGAFDTEAVRLSAQSLVAYAIGLPAFVVVKVLAPGFFARGDTSTPVRLGMIAVGLNLALNVAFMVPLRHIGPALATSLAAIANVGMLGILLARRGHLRFDVGLRRRLPRMAGACAAMSIAIAAAELALSSQLATGSALRWPALGLLIGVGGATYVLAGQALGAFDLRDVLRPLLARGRGRLARG